MGHVLQSGVADSDDWVSVVGEMVGHLSLYNGVESFQTNNATMSSTCDALGTLCKSFEYLMITMQWKQNLQVFSLSPRYIYQVI